MFHIFTFRGSIKSFFAPSAARLAFLCFKKMSTLVKRCARTVTFYPDVNPNTPKTNRHIHTMEDKLILLVSQYLCLYQMTSPDHHNIKMKNNAGILFATGLSGEQQSARIFSISVPLKRAFCDSTDGGGPDLDGTDVSRESGLDGGGSWRGIR